MNRLKSVSIELARFYSAELVNLLEHIHSKSIIHRDLKPENILLDAKFHLKLVDFGAAKICDPNYIPPPHFYSEGQKSTFVGTAEYVSPEVLLDKEVGYSADIWALGCIIYQLIAGKTPFKHSTEYLTFEKILKSEINFPKDFPPTAKDLIQRMLTLDPNIRLGSGHPDSEYSYKKLKSHPFFNGIDFATLHTKDPPIDYENLSVSSINLSSISTTALDITTDNSIIEEMKNEKSNGKSKEKLQFVTVREGIVEKKCGWFFFKKRKLVITSQPRMSYYEPEGNAYKGDITISSKVKAEKVNNRKFNLVTPLRTYYFKALDNTTCDDWIESINWVINTYCK